MFYKCFTSNTNKSANSLYFQQLTIQKLEIPRYVFVKVSYVFTKANI